MGLYAQSPHTSTPRQDVEYVQGCVVVRGEVGTMADAAKALVDQAEKRLSSFHWFDKAGRAQDAADLFKRAANQYKIVKNWNDAAKQFHRAAELNASPELENKSEAASTFLEAANCYKKVSPNDAVGELSRAVSIYVDMGRFRPAASTQQKIAEIYEDIVDYEKAMDAFRTAADWFQGEDDTVNTNKCKTKVATFESQMENYKDAADIFEGIAVYMANERNLHWSAKDYFFKAGVCTMLMDPVLAENKIQDYVRAQAAFENTAQYKFFVAAIKLLLDEGNEDELADLITTLSRSVRLDDWSVTMLFRVKKSLADDDL